MIVRDENGRERSGKYLKPLLISYFNSETRIGTGDIGRESGIGYMGIRNQNNLVGSMWITVGQRYFKTGTSTHVTTSNVQLSATDSTVHTQYTSK